MNKGVVPFKKCKKCNDEVYCFIHHLTENQKLGVFERIAQRGAKSLRRKRINQIDL